LGRITGVHSSRGRRGPTTKTERRAMDRRMLRCNAPTPVGHIGRTRPCEALVWTKDRRDHAATHGLTVEDCAFSPPLRVDDD
jgi:hypothetical protein